MPEQLNRLVVIGVGLIGGSIALAARQAGLAAEVIGVARSDAGARRAEAARVVDSATTSVSGAVAGAEVVVACTPVDGIADRLLEAAASCGPGTLLTDAGSTKRGIVEMTDAGLAAMNDPPAFVGSHPLAGDHRTGPESARADLLEGRLVVVTPSINSDAAAVDRTVAFWRSLGAETTLLSPQDHDATLAQTSHLPHLIAAALADATPAEALPLAATGWRDTTRVAAGDARLWREILLANRDPVLAAVGVFEESLAGFRRALEDRDGDRIEQLLEQGRRRREAVGD